MNKLKQTRNKELCNIMNALYPEYGKEEFREVLQIIVNTIEQEIKQGNEVQLQNFGTFYPKKNGNRRFVHPVTKEECVLPASVTFGFNASAAITSRVKQHFMEYENEVLSD